MKEIKNWKEIKRRTAEDGKVQVIYELNGYYIIVSEVSWMPGGLTIEANAIDRDSYLPNVYCTTSRKDDSVQDVRVQTTSWGALEISEIDKVMECYKAAQSSLFGAVAASFSYAGTSLPCPVTSCVFSIGKKTAFSG